MLFLVLVNMGLPFGRLAMASPWSWVDNYFGQRAFQRGEFQEAQDSFEKVIQRDPSAEDYYNLGASQYRQQDFEAARKSFGAAINSENPQILAKAYYNLGNTLYRLNRLPESVDAYEKALKVHPNDEEAKLNLEFVKRKLQQKPPPPSPKPNRQKQGDNKEKGKGSGQKGKQEEKQDQDKQNSQGDPGKGQKEQNEQKDQGQNSKEQNQEGQQDQEEQNSKENQAKDQQNEEPQSENQNKSEQKANKDPQNSNSKPQDKPQESQGQSKPEPRDKGQQGAQNSKPNPENSSKPGSQNHQIPEQPKDLSGKLTASGQQPNSAQDGKREGLAPAKEISPEAKEAERWLEMIEDRSQTVRKNLIRGAMGRSRMPEKDW